MVLTQQRLNFLHVCFREIGVFLRGNGSRNTGGFTRAATRGHNTEGCLCLVTAGNAAAGCKQVFDVLRHQASIGNGVVRALFEVIMARAGALRVVDAVLEDRTITHVIVNNKNGLATYKAKCFIDCTGDADLIKLVGASYQSGNHNRVNQPVSLRFDMAGIDFERFHAYMRSLGNDQYKYFAMNTPGMKDIIRKAYENGVLTEQDACYFQAFGIPGRPDGMNFNCRSMGEAAGIAAAMAVKNEAVRFNEIDGTAVRREIRLPDKF